MLEARGLGIGYRHGRRHRPQDPSTWVARGLELELAEGELVCLLGPNGAGKSTLLRTLAGLQPSLAGQIRLDGADIHALSPRQRARLLGVVLTDGSIPGHLSARALVALGRHPHTGWTGKLGDEDRRIVDRALDAVGATDLADRFVADSSDGERQKILVARALAQEPRLLLLDEITAFLDLPRRVEILGLLRDLTHRTGRTILMSTHDLDLALRSADRIWLLAKGGEMRTGAPEDLVLDGSFERVFASEGVVFDRSQGSFRIQRPSAGRVCVLEGPASVSGRPSEQEEERTQVRYWTARALRRQGLSVHEGLLFEQGPAGEAVRERASEAPAPTAPLRVEIVVNEGLGGGDEAGGNRYGWRLYGGGIDLRVDSLHALTLALRR